MKPLTQAPLGPTSTGDDAEGVAFVIDVYGVVEHLAGPQRGKLLPLSVRTQHGTRSQISAL